jgi:hypothetical protein
MSETSTSVSIPNYIPESAVSAARTYHNQGLYTESFATTKMHVLNSKFFRIKKNLDRLLTRLYWIT